MVKLISNPDNANPFSTTTLPAASKIWPLLVVKVPEGQTGEALVTNVLRRAPYLRNQSCPTR